jgi:hypothetical protein
MYESLLAWCRFPVSIHRYTGRSVAGDAQYTVEDSLCYRAETMRTITNKLGKEYVSYTQVYFRPEIRVMIADRISFPDDPNPREIYKLARFFDGTTGKPSITVVYL